MTTYAIGDIQGCYDELQDLLATISFNPQQDQLWLAGDLINRGPKSLEVLRFVKTLPNVKVVLGNHDIHLLALASGHPHKEHTLYEVLAAPDCGELVDWLRRQPLLHYDAALNFAMTHAGILPQWSLAQAQRYAHEVETVLQSANYAENLLHLYGNQPNQWQEELTGWDRLRFILNVFTRMRFCTPAGQLDFKAMGKIGSQSEGLVAWFQVANRAAQNINIAFGHWAALEGEADVSSHVFALDTGCVWGGSLTALNLQTGQRFSVRSRMRKVTE